MTTSGLARQPINTPTPLALESTVHYERRVHGFSPFLQRSSNDRVAIFLSICQGSYTSAPFFVCSGLICYRLKCAPYRVKGALPQRKKTEGTIDLADPTCPSPASVVDAQLVYPSQIITRGWILSGRTPLVKPHSAFQLFTCLCRPKLLQAAPPSTISQRRPPGCNWIPALALHSL